MKKKKKVIVEIRSTTQVTALYEIDKDYFDKNVSGEELYRNGKWMKNVSKPTYLHNVVSWSVEE